MKLLSERTIFAGDLGTRTANCCFPAIVRTAAGRLLATWRVGSQKDSADGAIWLSNSGDDGQTWSEPCEIVSPGMRDGVRGEPHYGPLTLLRDGRLLCTVMWVNRDDPTKPFFHPETGGLLPLRTLLFESRDGGQTWTEIAEMDSAPYDSPLAITGPTLELPYDQGWACPFEVNKHYEDQRPWRHAAAWKFSHDGGQTWPTCVELANDASGRLMYWDARAAIGPGQHCLAAFWTFDREANRDDTVHMSESNDLGKSWSAPRNLGIVGQVAEPVPLGDGRLLLIVVDRFSTRSILGWLSYDFGKTFVEKTVLYRQPDGAVDVGKDAATENYLQDMELWTFGRVHAVADSEGRVWVVYYAGDRRSTGIYCASLAV